MGLLGSLFKAMIKAAVTKPKRVKPAPSARDLSVIVASAQRMVDTVHQSMQIATTSKSKNTRLSRLRVAWRTLKRLESLRAKWPMVRIDSMLAVELDIRRLEMEAMAMPDSLAKKTRSKAKTSKPRQSVVIVPAPLDAEGIPEAIHYSGTVEEVKRLKRDGQHEQAERLLLKDVEATEQESAAMGEGWGVAPWYYEQLAIIYRKDGRYADEVAILMRYAHQPKAPGTGSHKLAERLRRAKELEKKHRH